MIRERRFRAIAWPRVEAFQSVLAMACAAMLLPVSAAKADPVTLDPDAVLALSEAPWSDRARFLDDLDTALGGMTVERPRLPQADRDRDPFLWSIAGRFGAPLAGVATPGGIVVCARYGLATRDRMAEMGLSDPETFLLLGATIAASDDAAVWPEAAVARLSCMITWDDTRRVTILPEEPVRAALSARFAEVARIGDAEFHGAGWQDYAPVFGAEGYRYAATAGRRDSVTVLDSALVERRVSHQRILFRSFLLAGGM